MRPRRFLVRRVSAAALVLCAAAPGIDPGRSAPQAKSRWDPALLEQWVAAVERHSPGDVDGTLATAAGWSGDDLRRLWVDTQVLLELVANPARSRFAVPRMSFDPERRVRGQERQRVTIEREDQAVFEALAARVRRRGLNPVLHRAAILHTDVVTQAAHLAAQAAATANVGPLRWTIGDGTSLAADGLNLHWELARMTMARVAPGPRQDPFVRDWYRATVAAEQAGEYFDALQLDQGLRLFPDDPELLLLKGAEREAMATPLFQAFARSIAGGARMTGIGSVRHELGEAAGFYRRALEANPALPEARVRLGHVYLLQGRHADAVREEEVALADSLDPLHRYFALLFMGAALEGLGRQDDALRSFEEAARYEGARVPHLAMARISRERGDRRGMTERLARALVPITEEDAVDPWWLYRGAQGRRRLSWLDDLRRRAREDRP